MHASMDGPPHPNMPGGGASLSRWQSFFRSGMKNSNWATTADMSHVLHLHMNTIGTFVNATLLTYLLNGEILLFIQTWPSQQKRTLGDRTRYSAARRRPHRNDSASFTTTSLDLGGAFDHKNFIGGRLVNCGRPWMTAREELLFTTRRCPWQRDAAEPAPSMPRCIQGISPLSGGYCGVPPPPLARALPPAPARARPRAHRPPAPARRPPPAGG